MDPRDLWLPRHKPAERQCAGCPFGENNDKQFGTILTHLRVKHQVRGKAQASPALIAKAREQVKKEIDLLGGEFVCHATAYGPGTVEMPIEQHRQCPGATAYYKRPR